jgi:HTH-type transcriptional regulator/antitoxin HipB
MWPIGNIAEEAAMATKPQTPPAPAAPPLVFLASPVELGRAIQAARQSRGLTQIDVAARARVNRRFVIELENGKPTAQLGKALTVMMGVGLVGIVVPLEAIQGVI